MDGVFVLGLGFWDLECEAVCWQGLLFVCRWVVGVPWGPLYKDKGNPAASVCVCRELWRPVCDCIYIHAVAVRCTVSVNDKRICTKQLNDVVDGQLCCWLGGCDRLNGG